MILCNAHVTVFSLSVIRSAEISSGPIVLHGGTIGRPTDLRFTGRGSSPG